MPGRYIVAESVQTGWYQTFPKVPPPLNIANRQKGERVWLGGREQDRNALLAAVQKPGPTPIPAHPAPVLLDDFESPAGRTKLDTLWLNNTDIGQDHARMSFQRTTRGSGNHVLSVLAEMSEKDRPFASVILPLSRGAVLPVDASRYRGIEFDARGDGEYALVLRSRTATAGTTFSAFSGWKRVRLPFSSFPKAEADDLTAVEFIIARPAGEKAFLEIDNVRFFAQ